MCKIKTILFCMFYKSDPYTSKVFRPLVFVSQAQQLCVIFNQAVRLYGMLTYHKVIQNPRSRSLIQKWSSYKKYFFYALGSSLHYIL